MTSDEGVQDTHLRVLILEDFEDDAELLVRELRRGGYVVEYQRVASRDDFRHALAVEPFDVILADYRLPGFNALDALRAVREVGTDTPVVLVSGTVREEDTLAAFDLGAHDFVLKNQLTRLVPAIQRGVRATEERRIRQAAEEALRQSEARYRELVENANDVVLMADLQGNFTSINRAGEQISGYSREELCRMNMAQVLTPDSYQRALGMIVQKLRGAGATVYELEMIARDGHHVPLELSTRMIYHGDTPVAIQGIARDITERKQAQAALAESEARYRGVFENASDLVYTHDLRGNFTSVNGATERFTGYTQDEVLKLNIADIVAPDHVDMAHSMIRRKLAEASQTTYELDIIAKDGSRSTIELNSQLIYENGTPIGVQGIARDVTARRRAEHELRARERKQAAVAKLGQHALASTDVSLLFNDTVNWVVHTLDVHYCTVLERSEDGTELIGRAGSGWHEEIVGNGRVGSGPDSFAGFTLVAGEPIIVEDFSRETRFSVPTILTAHGVRSGMSVIIAGSRVPFGVLTVFTNTPYHFARDDVHFLQAVANVLAAAIERKRLEEERTRHGQELATRVMQAQEEERKRIARELHDDTAQSLSMLLTNLDLVEPSIPSTELELHNGFKRVASLARRALDAVRALSHDLRPTILDDAGLEAALEWVAAEYEREFRGAAFVDARLPDDIAFSPELEVALFRIAQEALTNSGKHAEATTVWIRLRVEDGAAVLYIEDDGRGFDPESVPRPTREGRLGLYGMRERAALFGGTLTVSTELGRGTTVRAILPLPLQPIERQPEAVFAGEPWFS